MNISCVKQFMQHIPDKICILAPNSPMKKSVLPYGMLYSQLWNFCKDVRLNQVSETLLGSR